ESIRGTTATPLPPQLWGESTRHGSRLYLHVFHWPADGRLYLAGLKSAVVSARVLGQPASLAVRRVNASDVEIRVPARAPDPWDAVVVLDCASPIRADTALYLPTHAAPVELHVFNGWLVGRGIHYSDGKLGRDVVLGWKATGSGIDWPVRLSAQGRFRVVADFAPADSASGGTLELSAGPAQITVPIAAAPPLKPATPYRSAELGVITLEAGRHTLALRAKDVAGTELMRLQQLRLIPTPAQEH
ncbi:MAG TPA: hypothetical protein VF832_15605, partial [Longimicrobiales bacterium]